MERISNIQYLPYEVISTVVNDDYIDVEDDIHLPVGRISVLVTADYYDVDSRNYLIVTNDNKGDLTKHTDVDRFYERIIWSNTGGYYSGVMEQFEKWKGYYINGNNIMYLIKNELCIRKIRLLFDDGG